MFKNMFDNLLKRYYLLFIFLYFVICNIIFKNLFISGIIYYCYSIIIIILTIIIIIKNNDTLKFKKVLYIPFVISIIFSKNIFYALLLLIIFILISVLNFTSSHFIRIFYILFLLPVLYLMVLFLISFPMVTFIYILDVEDYNNYCYICNDYKICYDSGVFEERKILKLNNIIEIVYNKRIGDTFEEYNEIIEDKKCKVGEKDGV